MELVVVGGANGAGKSTLFKDMFQRHARIDPDEIGRLDRDAAGMTPALSAGRSALTAAYAAIDASRPLVFESTLAGRTAFALAEAARERGYRVTCLYVMLGDADAHVKRVRDRVAMGGHNVPDDVVRRRFDRSRTNFIRHLDAFDMAFIVDNTDKPQPVAHIDASRVRVFVSNDLTNAILDARAKAKRRLNARSP